MKKYTTPEQTAKLIELGFEKPKNSLPIREENKALVYQLRYTIGELIEMLPACIVHPIWWGDEIGEEGVWGLRIDSGGTEYGWDVSYERHNSTHLYREGRSELTDALYDMIVKLKEEGVI